MDNANQNLISRRKFFNKVSVALIGLSSILIGIPVIGFLFIPLFRKVNRGWRKVGNVDQFKVGTTVAVSYEDPSALPWSGVSAKTAAWLRRDSETKFMAFSINCTHLGCPVRWLPDANLFMCPCHGGVYYKNGNVAAGPPPEALRQYPVRVKNNDVEIFTSPIPII